jgi:hypothetical protein
MSTAQSSSSKQTAIGVGANQSLPEDPKAPPTTAAKPNAIGMKSLFDTINLLSRA